MNLLGVTFGLFLLSSRSRRQRRSDDTNKKSRVTRCFAAEGGGDKNNNKYSGLKEWLSSIEGAEINDKIELKPSTRGGGFGAFLTDDVQEGDILFTVPRKACITLQDAKSDAKCGELFQKLIEKAGPGGNTVALAGFIAKERLQSLKEDQSSSYQPYLNTLPWERGVNNQEHILYWSDEEVESLLKDSMCYGEAIDLRKEVTLAIKVLDSIIGKPEDDGQFKFPWQKVPEPQEPVEGLPDAVKAAFVCLLTRSFQDDGDEEKLVPMLDMLQHSDRPNVSHAMRKVDGTVEVRARRDLQAGEELLNQYRSEMEENMPYHRFFTRFGFVPGIQEPIENLLQDKSSIFFAQKAAV